MDGHFTHILGGLVVGYWLLVTMLVIANVSLSKANDAEPYKANRLTLLANGSIHMSKDPRRAGVSFICYI